MSVIGPTSTPKRVNSFLRLASSMAIAKSLYQTLDQMVSMVLWANHALVHVVSRVLHDHGRRCRFANHAFLVNSLEVKVSKSRALLSILTHIVLYSSH